MRFDYIGYEPLSKTDIIVKSKRITFVNAELKMTMIESEDIIVTAGYFSQIQAQPTSATNFSSEEIRRAPGSVGDVSRILNVLPGVARVNDMSNDLLVRGGSPSENAFFIDNIEIPNINHFPSQGASGGPIGILNVDFIEDVNFYTGGFSAAYGDRLSSILDITFRDGNRDEFDGQLDLNFSGFGGIAEGPLANGKGSWFISGKRSFLDLLVYALGTGTAPRFGDIQGKLSYDINNQNKIIILNIFGNSSYKINQDDAIEIGDELFGKVDIYQNTFGINWRSLWSKNGYSNTSISYAFITSSDLWHGAATGRQENGNDYLEGAYSLRNMNYYQFNKTNKIEFGIDTKYEITDYDYFFSPDTNRLGEFVDRIHVENQFNAKKAGVYVNYIWNPLKVLTTTLGLRGDYSSYNDNFHLSPRFSTSLKINERISLNGAFGIYHQTLPLFLLSQNPDNKELDDPIAVHYILGLDYLLTADTKLTVEVYDKEYQNFPLDPDDPMLFVMDDGIFSNQFGNYNKLEDKGEAYSRGIELLIQKKMAKDFYGLISASYFRSRYKDYNGIWRNRIYDNQYIFSVIGGYKPSNKWEFSIRWNFAGGVPYTPFDIEKSKAFNTGIIDQTSVNTKRYPDYHSMNIRCDRRFFFQGSSLVTYLSVWNAYNHKNIFNYYWNTVENQMDTKYQWSLLPIFGLEYEF